MRTVPWIVGLGILSIGIGRTIAQDEAEKCETCQDCEKCEAPDPGEARAAVGAAPALLAPAPAPGTVSGKVVFAGKPKKPKKIDTSSDPFCSAAHGDEPLRSEAFVSKEVEGEHRLQWVFVSIEGVTGEFKAPETPALLDQVGCRYVPHVLWVMVGQKLKIRSSDATTHNIKAQPKSNKEFNITQSKKGEETEVCFDKPERAISVSCNVHTWMQGFIFVTPHPFNAVTDENGTFEIKGVPAGKYKIKAWHETLGEREQDLTVEEGKSVSDIVFKFAE